MGWLLELLFEGIKELCSQFIIDMMDIASSMFTEILSCDLDLFEELFGVAGDLYRNGIMPIAIMLLLMILVWQLFKGMFSRITTSSEEPLELVFRSAISLFMIAYAKDIVNYILDIVGTPYQWVTGTAVTVSSFSGYVTAAEAVVSVLGIDVISIQMLLLIMHFVVAWNYFKMLFILAERYVLLGIFSYTAPLAFAAGGSKSTNNITTSWVRMFGGQVLIVILDAWCVKMFLSGYGNLMSSSYGFTKFFAATMCLIGFCKITAKLDSYMASLGVNLGRIGGGLSGMGALLMAGRLLHMGGGGRSGGSPDKGAAQMAFGSGKSIPLGSGSPDFGAESMAGMQGGSGIGGMGNGMSADGSGNPGEDFGPQNTGEDFNGFDYESPGTGEQYAPFGPQDESDLGAQEGFADGMENLDGMENTALGQETDQLPFGEDGMPVDGSYAEAGEIPGMGYGEDGPFGPAFGDGDLPDTGSAMEENAVSSFGGTGQDMGLDVPGETGGISGMQEVSGAGEMPGAGMEGTGVLSYSGSESTTAGETAGDQTGTQTGGAGIMSAENLGGLESQASTVHSGVPGGGSAEIGEAGARTAETGAIGTGTVGGGRTDAGSAGSLRTDAGAAGGAQAHTMGAGIISEGGMSAATSSAGAVHGSDAVSAGGARGTSAVEAGPGAGSYGRPGENGLVGNPGAYLAERDGERYMRYDASQYEKPQGAYQTIHEDGKTYYELPERDKAPAELPETRAVLEKNGELRLEKVYREIPQEKKPDDPKKKPDGRKNPGKKNPGRK